MPCAFIVTPDLGRKAPIDSSVLEFERVETGVITANKYALEVRRCTCLNSIRQSDNKNSQCSAVKGNQSRRRCVTILTKLGCGVHVREDVRYIGIETFPHLKRDIYFFSLLFCFFKKGNLAIDLKYLQDHLTDPVLASTALTKPEWEPTTKIASSPLPTRSGELSMHFSKLIFHNMEEMRWRLDG